MKRPKSVKVGYQRYAITYLTNGEWLETQEEGLGGVSEHEEGRIILRVTPDRHEDSLRETLLHEITHAVWAITGMNHGYRWNKIATEDIEEMVVTVQSPTMLAVLADNPAVLAYLINLGEPG